MQKEFVLTGKMHFMAESVDDAFFKIAQHFLKLSDGEPSDLLIPGSGVTLEPVRYIGGRS